PTQVRFHNRTADGQSKAKAIRLCGLERLKQFGELVRVNAGSAVAHLNLNQTGFELSRANGDPPLALRNLVHRVERVQHEIQHDLLQLDSVAPHGTETRIQIERDANLSDHGVAMQQANHILNQPVQIECFELRFVLLNERAHLANDLARTFGVLGNI